MTPLISRLRIIALLFGLLSATVRDSFAQRGPADATVRAGVRPAEATVKSGNSPANATVREYQQTFPTYPFSDPSPIPLLTQVYPYFRYDGFTDKAVSKSWKVVELQNDYIRLLILPEIGGKIWAAIEKSTGRPFLYYNHAVKFRDVAMRGPWTSGGLEANYGIIGHTPNCATPVDYVTRVNADGSVSCTIGTLELLSRSYWRMEIRLDKDQALFSTRSFWYNTTALEQPYYHWMNAGLKADGDLEFVYPGNRYLGHEGEYSDWPINKSNGKKISWYKENNFGGYKSYHVFGKYTEFSGAYWHNDDMGMVRWGTHDDKAGKKIWIWGLSRQGMIWDKLLTDTDGQYVEVQSGRLFNQNAEGSSRTPFKHRAFAPYGTETWAEDWYPVLGTRGFVAANEYGALNVLRENGWLKVFFSPVVKFEDTLCMAVNGKTIYRKGSAFVPLQVFRDSVRLEETGTAGGTGAIGGNTASTLPDSLVVTIGNHRLHYESSPLAGNLARPVDAPVDFDWTSAYGNYLKGCEALDQKNMPEAEAAFGQALSKDPNYEPALVKMAELLYRNMRYPEALAAATRALRIHTEDGGANWVYGLVNEQLGHITDAKDGYDIASLDPAYRSAAYTRLAKIYLREQDILRARSYARKALINNQENIEALQLLAVCARLAGGARLTGGVETMGKVPVAGTSGGGAGVSAVEASASDATEADVLARIDRMDPLNHFVRSEKYFADSSPAGKHQFLSLIRNELPQETFLELGIWYYDCGLPEEALRVFRLSPPCAEISLWISRLASIDRTKQTIDWTKIDPVRSFPFRSETGQLLEELLSSDNHWFIKYQLALIYKDRNRIAECKKLLLSCGDQPDFAPFYAMRAAVLSLPGAQGKSEKPETGSIQSGAASQDSVMRDLLHAVQLDPQWRYQKLLAEEYIRRGLTKEALAIAGKWYQVHPDQYIMGMLYAKTLLLDQQFAAADKILTQLNIIPFEGATSGRELYREAKLMQAVQYLKKKQYKKALFFIGGAKEWPEHLGVGRPYPADEDLRLEDWMSNLCLYPSATPVPLPSVGTKSGMGVNDRVLRALE